MPGLVPAKLAIPYQGLALARPRLRAAVNGLRHGGLVSVVAGPGYGKTALLADLLSAPETAGMYYSLDEGDQDPAQFLAYLIEGLSRTHPGLGDVARERLDECVDPRQEALHVVGALLSEMVGWAGRPTVIALDDMHRVEQSEAVLAAVGFLLDGLPPGWTVVLSSRQELPVSLDHFRANGQLVNIDLRRLRLTPTEVREWAAGLWGIDLPLEEARSLWRVTEGWPVGLVILGQRLPRWRHGRLTDDLRGLSRQGRHLNEYLAENVFKLLEESTADVLHTSSLLPRVCFPRDAQIFGGDPEAAERVLEGLVARGFLVTQTGHRTYSVHPLVRAFAERDMRRADPDSASARASAVARHLESVGELREAVTLYLRAGKVEDAMNPMRALAIKHLNATSAYAGWDWMELFPETVVEREPWLLLLRARILQERGEHSQAEPIYKAAARLFDLHQDRSGHLRALLGQAFCLYLLGRWDDSLMQLTSAERVAGGRDERAEVYLSMGNVLLSQCCWDQAVERYEQALALASPEVRRSMEVRVFGHRAHLFHLRGRYTTALEWVRRAVALAAGEGRMAYAIQLNAAATLLYLTGRYDQAAIQAEAALALVRARGYAFLEAPVLLSLAGVSLGRRDVRSAVVLMRKAQDLSRHAHDAEAEVYADDMLGDVCRRNRNPERALEHHRRALEVIEQHQLAVYEHVRALCGVGMDLSVIGEKADAEATLDQVIDLARRWGFDALLVQALFYRGWFYALDGKEQAGRRTLGDMVRLASDQDHVHFLLQESAVAVPVLALCHRFGLGVFLDEHVVPRLSRRLGDYYRTLTLGSTYPTDVVLGPPRRSRLEMSVPRRAMPDDTDVADVTRRVESLTGRELEILRMVAAGLPNKVIAARLVITEKTVKTHTYNTYRKLGVTNRLQAVLVLQESERTVRHGSGGSGGAFDSRGAGKQAR